MTETSDHTAEIASNSGCVLEYDDLRDWLAAVEAKGDLKTVTGANWHTDIGQVVEVMCHDEGTPSVLFDEVEGCPPGFRILINWFTGTRKNLTLGFPGNFNKLELSRGYSTHTKNMKPVPHEIVDDGPVFENVLEGDDIDVTRFPAPAFATCSPISNGFRKRRAAFVVCCANATTAEGFLRGAASALLCR